MSLKHLDCLFFDHGLEFERFHLFGLLGEARWISVSFFQRSIKPNLLLFHVCLWLFFRGGTNSPPRQASSANNYTTDNPQHQGLFQEWGKETLLRADALFPCRTLNS